MERKKKLTQMHHLECVVVEISRDGKIGCGTGFYISQDIVVTCYHVLIPKDGGVQEHYWIRHDRWGEDWVKAVPWNEYCHPLPHDVAVLYSDRKLPGNMICQLEIWNKLQSEFKARGYDRDKKKYKIGANIIKGDIVGATIHKGIPRLQLEAKEGTIKPGRSGSPVWSIEQNAIVGMIAWVGGGLGPKGQEDALAIPIENIVPGDFDVLIKKIDKNLSPSSLITVEDSIQYNSEEDGGAKKILKAAQNLIPEKEDRFEPDPESKQQIVNSPEISVQLDRSEEFENWLKSVGLKRNPFEIYDANDERWLSDYFVPTEVFDIVIKPLKTIIFADKGCGKTASRRMVEDQCFKTKIFPISYDDKSFQDVINQANGILGNIKLYDHVEAIIKKALPSLLDYLFDYPDAIFDTPDSFSLLRTFLTDFTNCLTRHNLDKRIKWSGLTCKKIKDAIKSDKLEYLFSKAEKCYRPKLRFVAHLLEDDNCEYKLPALSPLELMNYLSGIIKDLGFNSIYILIDNIDKFPETRENPKACALLLSRLLESENIFDIEGVYFKLFLPAEMNDHLRGIGAITIPLKCSPEDLRNILKQRLVAVTEDEKNLIKKFAQIFHDAYDIEEKIIDRSVTPRDVIKFGNKIIYEFFNSYTYSSKVTKQGLNSLFGESGEQRPKPESKSSNKEIIINKNVDDQIIKILHLSDIHVQNLDQAKKFRTQVEEDLRKELKVAQLDYIVITGDIANAATSEEYKAAFELMDGLIKNLKIESKNKIIMVPGNHDLNWNLSKKAYNFVSDEEHDGTLKKGKYIQKADGVLLPDKKEHRKRFYFFRSFYKKLYNKTYPLPYDKQGIIYEFPNDQILFLGLNSSWEIDHHFRDHASINTDALNNALDQLLQKQREYSGWLKIAAWHHPVTGTEMMEDAFMQRLTVHGFEICMHGHIHNASQGFYTYDPKRGIHIIGAGTFGGPTTDRVPYQYNLLTYDKQKKNIIVESRRKDEPNGAWMADARWGDRNNPVPRYEIPIA